MKTLVMLTTLLAASVALAVPPKLTEVSRLQLTQPGLGSVVTKDQQGQPIYVTFQERDKLILDIVAYGANGVPLATSSLFRPKGGQQPVIMNVGFNDKGEIIAIIGLFSEGLMQGVLRSENLTTGKGMQLVDIGRYPQFMGRITFGGQQLVAVAGSLGSADDGTNPTVVLVLNELTGKIVRKIDLDQSVSGQFGVSTDGRLKILAMGYGTLGVIDVESEQFTNLISSPQYPQVLKTSLGTVLKISDANELRLLKLQDFLDGKVTNLRVYPGKTLLVGEEPFALAEVPVSGGVVLEDIKTQKEQSPVIPASLFNVDVPSVQVLKTKTQNIALFETPNELNSFMPGSVFTYVDLKMGQVLAKHTFVMQPRFAQLIEVDGKVLTLEREMYSSLETREFTVIDVAKDKVLSSGTGLIGPATLSNSGSLVGLHGNTQKQVCVANLLAPSEETCIQDVLVNDAVQYGYNPLEVSKGLVTLPLLGNVHGFSYDQMGMVQIQVD